MPPPPNKKPTGWEDLPTEIKVIIIHQLCDLGSLGALFHASPTLYRSSGNNVREYTEAILASGYVCGHTAVLFRLCALIQSGKLPVRTTKEFFERVTGEAMCYDARIVESPRGIAPRSLEEDVDPTVVRRLLMTAHRIQNLAGSCLQFYLARFKTLRPESNPSWKRGRRKKKAVPYYFECIDGEPVGTPYKVQDLGGFEWEEEQRAIRAIWRVQLIYELKQAVLTTRVLEWEDPQVLKSAPAIELPLGQDRVTPISFYGSRSDYNEYIYPVRSKIYVVRSLRYQGRNLPHPEYEEICSMAEFIRDQRGEGAGVSHRNGFLCLGQLKYKLSDPIPTLHPTPRVWRKLIDPTDATLFYFFSRFNSAEGLPFRFKEFDHFAQFGFAFWSNIRMQQYGFIPTNKTLRLISKACHAWYSITSQTP
ncbi:hypothetical protein NQ176_g9904 [Zarea fungicola]|uniref:Uncharacterized protein n=1 Tax=Zarea fungicola TaxID=93591 RepID=A0ACC1MJV4_9HYPO|nr:hypothetical protein NQ176_g9904 [Lecanicillium fungicola]